MKTRTKRKNKKKRKHNRGNTTGETQQGKHTRENTPGGTHKRNKRGKKRSKKKNRKIEKMKKRKTSLHKFKKPATYPKTPPADDNPGKTIISGSGNLHRSRDHLSSRAACLCLNTSAPTFKESVPQAPDCLSPGIDLEPDLVREKTWRTLFPKRSLTSTRPGERTNSTELLHLTHSGKHIQGKRPHRNDNGLPWFHDLKFELLAFLSVWPLPLPSADLLCCLLFQLELGTVIQESVEHQPACSSSQTQFCVPR